MIRPSAPTVAHLALTVHDDEGQLTLAPCRCRMEYRLVVSVRIRDDGNGQACCEVVTLEIDDVVAYAPPSFTVGVPLPFGKAVDAGWIREAETWLLGELRGELFEAICEKIS